MYYRFPDRQVFHFALSSGLIPAELAAAPCQAAELEDGGLLLKSGTRPLRTARGKLTAIGVGISRLAPSRETLHERTSWLELIPLVERGEPWGKVADERELQSGILLVFSDWPSLAGASREILRLGNDRQAMRSVQAGGRELHLLHVVAPPLYSLLSLAEDEAATMLRPLRQDVWIQADTSHEFADRVVAPPNTQLLITQQFGWLPIQRVPFEDLYERVDFEMPEPAQRLDKELAVGRLAVPLTLRPDSNPADPTLWVIRDEGLEQLHRFVEASDNQVVAQLAFAVGRDANGRDIVVVRARGERARPLTLPGRQYRSYLRIPNLFVPVGRRLHPPLRRDAAAKTLAPNSANVVWLDGTDSGFQPHVIADDAFRPLADWVDYVVELEAESLQAWVDAHQFGFDAYLAADNLVVGDMEAGIEEAETAAADGQSQQPEPVGAEADANRPQHVAPLEPIENKSKAPSQLREDLRETEQAFLDLETPLDAAEREPLWARMGDLQSRLEDEVQSGLCYSNAAWTLDAPRAGAALAQWGNALRRGPSLAKTLERMESPAQSTRLMGLLATARENEASFVAKNMAEVSQRVEQLEAQTSMRVAWLAWLSLARIAGGDALALSRARDRMLTRLYEDGLRVDVDLPLFLRNCDIDQERHTQVREFLHSMPAKAKQWINDQGTVTRSPSTYQFAGLCIAFGMARIGERGLDGLLNSLPDNKDPASKWVRSVFDYRIGQVMRGEAFDTELPEELLRQLETRSFRSRVETVRQTYQYLLDRLRNESRILERREVIDPYRHNPHRQDWTDLGFKMKETRERNALKSVMSELLNVTRKKNDPKPFSESLAACLEVAPRTDERTAGELLKLVPKAVAQSDVGGVGRIIKHGLYLAGHFDLDDDVKQLLKLFRRELLAPADVASRKALDESLGECFSGLRRLGLRGEIEKLLDQLMEVAEQDLAKPRTGDSKPADSARELRMKLLLHVASGRFYFGQVREAERVLDIVREAMLTGGLARDSRGRGIHASTAHRYVQALRYAPVQVVVQRIDDLLTNLRGVYDTFTTNVLYSRYQLTFIEECVLVLVSDDVALSTGGRRWLDDDEYLVRKRIHADVRAALGKREDQP